MGQLWFIQSNLTGHENELTAFVRAFQGLMLQWAAVPVLPFEKELRTIPWDGPRVFYGSTKLVKLAHENRAERDPFFFDPEKYKTSVWGRALGWRYNTSAGVLTTVEHVLRREVPHVEGEFFVRPDADLKSFVGQVIDIADAEKRFTEWSHGWTAFDRNAPVLVAPVKKLISEVRLWMVEGEPVAGVAYRSQGKRISAPLDLSDPDLAGLVKFASECDHTLEDFLDQVYVLDVARVSPSEAWTVMEVNSFHASGFYHELCVLPVIRAVSDHVAKYY
jgi:hypothetical protein